MELAVETIRVLRRFKNVVLEGPPGTGKSHVVKAIAEQWQMQTQRPLLGAGYGKFAITLHPSTTYEEFVEGLRYDEHRGAFTRQDGFLLRVINEAKMHPEGDFLVLIDELNRANVPKVFGDLLLCMESSKRQVHDGAAWISGMEVTLPYSGAQFSMPNNVFLLGTMNSSDRSIAPLDSALRRRFGFVQVEPIMGTRLRSAIEAVDGVDAVKLVDKSIEELTNLNEGLRTCLGPNAMLGHSYLFGASPTDGVLASPDDPLADLRMAASRSTATGAFWLEVGGMWGGNKNQLDLPDRGKSRTGIVDSFYPMTSGGVTKSQRSSLGQQDRLDIIFAGKKYEGNTIEYNKGGSNIRLKYQGRTTLDEGFSVDLQQKIHVWVRQTDNTFELVALDRSRTVLDALRAASTNPGWSEKTGGANGRAYGELDLHRLLTTAEVAPPTSDQDAEWMIWRYAILPQLIDTVTQVGATDLLDPGTRQAWLEAAGYPGTVDRWAKFDRFLTSMSIAIREEGYGLTRGLMVIDIPAGAASQYLPEDDDVDDVKDFNEIDHDNSAKETPDVEQADGE